jgi:DNA-binding phage protein
MPLTISFKETLLARLERDPEFAVAMLREGIDALFSGELSVAKDMLRDYINATIGFEKLAKKVKIPPKSLMRMLGPSGNPQMSNLFAIIGALQAHAGIELHVAAE